jgi:hypothetical protein
MIKCFVALSLTALVASAANAQPPIQSVNDRIEALCAVSDLDMAGKRLARECRAQVRAQSLAVTQARSIAQAARKPSVVHPRLAQLPK